MRTKIIIGAFLLFSEMMVGQTFRKAFDVFDNSQGQNSALPGQGQSMFANTAIFLSGPGPGYLTGYLNMFKATKDVRYIQRFAIQAKRFMDRRDDNITSICGDPGPKEFGFPYYPAEIGCPTVTGTGPITSWELEPDNIQQGFCPSKSWSHSPESSPCYQIEHELAQDADILYPMVFFTYLLLTDPDFQGLASQALPAEATDIVSNLNNYGDLAYMLCFKSTETVDWWNITGHWVNSANLDPTNAQTLPDGNGNQVAMFGYVNDDKHRAYGQVNMQAAMGSVLILLDEIFALGGRYAIHSSTYYSNQIDILTTFIKDQIHGNRCDLDCLFWTSQYVTNGAYGEDDGHALATFRFAHLCYNFGLPNGTDSYFNITWMQQFARTFATKIYLSPLKFNESIQGASTTCPLSVQVSGNFTTIGGYSYMTEFNPYIYGIISDYYSRNSLYSPALDGNNDPNIDGYSQLTLVENTPDFLGSKYLNIFNPISVWPTTQTTWSAVTTGDYLGDGNFEVAATSGTSDNITISSVDPVTRMQNPVANGNTDVQAPVQYMVSGKLLGVSSGPDAIITIGSSGLVDLLAFTGSNLVSLPSNSSPFPPGLQIKGAAAGNFDQSNPGDEAILIGSSGNLSLLEYLPNATPGTNIFKFIDLNLSVSGITDAAGMASGHFDNTGALEIAITDNTGLLNIYSLNSTLTSISLLYTYSVPQLVGGQVLWDGITSGDFLGLGYDQVIAHSGFDGQFLLYQADHNSYSINRVGCQAFPDGNNMPDGQTYQAAGGGISSLNNFSVAQKWQNGLMACLKKCPGTGNAALVTLRNSDGQATIYDMEGNCQGLSVSNNYFYDETFPANNPVSLSPTPPPSYTGMSPTSNQLTGDNSDYPIDYHVARNLTASNDLVYPNTNVNFIAGNEVAMTGEMGIMSGSNFSAHIDNTLTCNPEVVIPKAKTNRPTPNQIVNTPPVQPNHSTQLLVQPNPSTGLFIANTVDGTTGQLFLYDLRGKLVYSNGDYSLNTWNLDLNSYPEGIYYLKVISKNGAVLSQKVVHQ